MKACFRLTAFTLALTLVFSTFPTSVYAAGNGMIGTGDVIAHTGAAADRAFILSVLDRDDIVAQLERQGVSIADARLRVAALSDQEAQRMAAQLENMPAGASDVLGVVVGLFLILLVTDLLGLTSVFPFTRPRARI